MLKLKKIIQNNWQLSSVFFVSVILLLWNISGRTFWMDETAVLLYLKYPVIDFIKYYWTIPDNHPPLYYFLVLLVSKILPWNELMVRLVSVISGIGIVCLVYQFTLKISASKTKAGWAAFFTVFSSFFVLISQMARYHSLAAFFSLLTFYLFYLLYTEGYKKKIFFLYLACLLFTAYSDYPHFIYTVVITNVFFLYLLIKKQAFVNVARWIQGQFLAAIACLPLVYIIYQRIVVQGDGGWEKVNLLSNSWLNITAGILFHIYVFFFGENIFPWNILFFVAGAAVLFTALFSLIANIKKNLFSKGEQYILLLTVLLVILNTFFMNKADPRYNFTIYPKFGFVAFPLFIMSIYFCLDKIVKRRIKFVVFFLWIIIAGFGLYNFYTLSNYFNGSYFRNFETFNFVRENSVVGEYLVVSGDLNEGVYQFYESAYFEKLRPLDLNIFKNGAVATGTKVWFFSTGSDDTSSSIETVNLIPAGYAILKRFDSVPLDPTLKYYKEKFLHRPSYTYKYSVFLLKKI
ncbi:MAG: glycosyltransferase family 39 protein [Patescibacteria group bacterium]